MSNRGNALLILGVLLMIMAALVMVGNSLGDRTIPAAIILGIVGIIIITKSRKAKASAKQ